jgi:hypothetical protein
MASEPEQAGPVRERDNNVAVDRRLIVLETRFDTILPMLATRADLAEMKAQIVGLLAQTKSELKAEILGLSRWMATMTITVVLGLAGMIATLYSVLSR